MKTKEIFALLKAHQNKSLLFEYQKGKTIGANYHITEVKNITVDSIDCGARTDYWKETVIQLWESPVRTDKKEYMSVDKALGILNKVHSAKPMDPEAEVKLEYGNPSFHTAQLFVKDVTVDENSLLIRLAVEQTTCKAREECGLPHLVQEAEVSCCTPDSGCC